MANTLIIDNNRKYSGHQIFFVEAPADFKEYLTELENFLRDNDDESKIPNHTEKFVDFVFDSAKGLV